MQIREISEPQGLDLAARLTDWAIATLEPVPQFNDFDFEVNASKDKNFVSTRADTLSGANFQFGVRLPPWAEGQGASFWDDQTIVVNRMVFYPGRQGHGGAFLRQLALFGADHGFEHVGFEFISGPAAFKAFTIKHGFQQIGAPDDFCRIIRIEKLIAG